MLNIHARPTNWKIATKTWLVLVAVLLVPLTAKGQQVRCDDGTYYAKLDNSQAIVCWKKGGASSILLNAKTTSLDARNDDFKSRSSESLNAELDRLLRAVENETQFWKVFRYSKEVNADLIVRISADHIIETTTLEVYDAETNDVLYEESRTLVSAENDAVRLIRQFLSNLTVYRQQKTSYPFSQMSVEGSPDPLQERESDPLRGTAYCDCNSLDQVPVWSRLEQSPKIGVLHCDEPVTIVADAEAEEHGFYHVRTRGGLEGYVSKFFLTHKTPMPQLH